MVVCVVGREHASIHPYVGIFPSICWDIHMSTAGYPMTRPAIHVSPMMAIHMFPSSPIQLPRYPVVQISRYPVTQMSRYPVIKISNHPDIRMSRYPVIQISSRPDIQLSTYPGDIAEMEVVDAHWRSQKWKLWTLWAAKMEVVAVTTTIFAKIEGMASILSLPNYPMRILCCFFLGVVELYISTPGGLSVFLAAFFFRGCHLFVGV